MRNVCERGGKTTVFVQMSIFASVSSVPAVARTSLCLNLGLPCAGACTRIVGWASRLPPLRRMPQPCSRVAVLKQPDWDGLEVMVSGWLKDMRATKLLGLIA